MVLVGDTLYLEILCRSKGFALYTTVHNLDDDGLCSLGLARLARKNSQSGNFEWIYIVLVYQVFTVNTTKKDYTYIYCLFICTPLYTILMMMVFVRQPLRYAVLHISSCMTQMRFSTTITWNLNGMEVLRSTF